MSNRICKFCGVSFEGSARAWYCHKCKEGRTKKTVAKGIQRYPDKDNYVKYRVYLRRNKELLSLGEYPTLEEAKMARDSFIKANPADWSKPHMITTNINYFMTRRREILKERKYCNRCNKYLLNLNRFEWCVHHIDHDRTNNTEENFELLCKACHQAEHATRDEKGRYSQSSTTIPKGSTPKQVEAVGTSYINDVMI